MSGKIYRYCLDHEPNQDHEYVSALVSRSTVRRIWSGAVIALGLTFTTARTCLLGYGLVKVIEYAF
jgi:hypothetical protein